MGSAIDARATETTRRYDRLARVYDRLEVGTERRFAPWRVALWERVCGPRVLEAGMGTGKDLACYP